MNFRKKRSSPQKEREASASAAIPATHNDIDWVSNAFQVTELASAAGSLLPFPYLKGAAEIVKTLLMPIQQIQQNRGDYKILAINITAILQILHEETKKHHETALSLNYFEKDCETFYRCLQRISNDLKSFNNNPDKSRPFRRFFFADREKDYLAQYQNEIEEFQENLLLRGVICLQISGTNEMASDFKKIRLGDLYVLRSSSSGQVEHWEVRWRHETQTRMVRVYKGQNATLQFKAEKEWYSRYRHPNMMQLFGLITCKESPGLVFHNSWCIPRKEYFRRFVDPLRLCADHHRLKSCFDQGLHYIATSISHHALLSWRDCRFIGLFVGFENRDDGYLGRTYVNILDGRGVVAFEWSPKIIRDIPIYHRRSMVIDIKPLEDLARIVETVVDMLRLFKQSGTTTLLKPKFLRDFYGAINVSIFQDVSAPAYPVHTGDILLVDEHTDALDTSNAAMMGFIPCEEPLSLRWFIRNEKLHTYFETENKLSVEDCGEHFRICLPVDTVGISASENIQTVVIECDVLYSRRATWAQLARAYVSQINYLHAKFGRRRTRASNSYYAVTGFSWHLQIPIRLRCSVGNSEHKELYFFISKPTAHDETLDTYWSLNLSGSERLNCSDIDTLGFNSELLNMKFFRTLRGFYVSKDHFHSIWDVHNALNIDPASNEGARILGLPLIRTIEAESGDGSDDSEQDDTCSSESYYTAKDGANDERVD